MSDSMWVRAGRGGKWYTALCALLQPRTSTWLAPFLFKLPVYRDNHYVSPPPIIRYTLERWSVEDDADNTIEGIYHTGCDACHGMYGPYCIGQWYVDDTLSIDTFHVTCAPRRVRWLAFIGTVLCALRVTLGIDDKHTHTV